MARNSTTDARSPTDPAPPEARKDAALVERCATAAYDVLRAYRDAMRSHNGEAVEPLEWDGLDELHRQRLRNDAQAALESPHLTPRHSHEAWRAALAAEGWTWGPRHDGDVYQHPELVPYDRLTMERRAEAAVFIAAARATARALAGK